MSNQGRKANRSGAKNEAETREILANAGFKTESLRYMPMGAVKGNRKKTTDHYIPSLKMVVESKHQDIAGTADQKLCTELNDARRNFSKENRKQNNIPPVEHYVIVLSGKSWQKATNQHKIDAARESAAIYREHPSCDLKSLDVIFRDDLESYLKTI